MQSSKLLKLLKLLTKEECRRFKKMLQSPFFTTNKHLVKIYEYLIKDYPEFTSPKLDKTLIFAHLFPKIKYNDNKLRMLFRAFTRQLEDFLIIKEVRENEEARKKQLVHIYGQRNQMELFEKGTFQLLEEMEAMPIKDKNHFFEQQQLIQRFIHHPIPPSLEITNRLQAEMMDKLDLHYISNKIWLSCTLLSTQKFINAEYSLGNVEKLLEEIPIKHLQIYPPLDTFIKAFQFLQSPSDSYYFTLKEAYLKTLSQINKTDKRDLFVYLLNYTILKANQGENLFNKENFKLYKIGLEEKLLVENERFDENTFLNCFTIAVSQKEFIWAENFLHNYKQYIDEKNVNDTSVLCKSYLSFFKQDFVEVIKLIASYHFERFADKFRAKSLLLRSYCELFLKDSSYYILFISYSYSHEKFFRRNKSIAKNKIEPYLNLINILRRITKLIHESKWSNEQKLKFIQKAKFEKIALKKWLLEKLEAS